MLEQDKPAWKRLTERPPPGCIWMRNEFGSRLLRPETGEPLIESICPSAWAYNCSIDEAWCEWQRRSFVTRRDHAEMLAPKLVREAADEIRAQGLCADVCHTWDSAAGHVLHTFTVEIDRRAKAEFSDPDICAAALASINALKGACEECGTVPDDPRAPCPCCEAAADRAFWEHEERQSLMPEGE